MSRTGAPASDHHVCAGEHGVGVCAAGHERVARLHRLLVLVESGPPSQAARRQPASPAARVALPAGHSPSPSSRQSEPAPTPPPVGNNAHR